MTEEQYKIVDLKETLAIADKDNCKYYQNDNEHFEELCELLNKQDNDNKFLFRIINFFAKNPMTKYSSIEELFEEMRMLDEMGLL